MPIRPVGHRVAVLGSTGSIGTNTMRVLQNLGAGSCVVGLAAGRNTALLAEQARQFHPQWVYSEDADALTRESLPAGTAVLSTLDELCDAVSRDDLDTVECSIVGTAGLRPALAALNAGKDLALASKEVLVMAGSIMVETARRTGARILPVDSEHCAIFQCLDQHRDQEVSRIILTCSGGPFHGRPEIDLSTVTLAQTLKHPTWNMGRKITIDCATLMNKGLEVIEAKWLFDVPEEKIEVAIHPQSIVHSMVEFCDSSVIAQMGLPDMCLPIQYCLTYPTRVPGVAKKMDFGAIPPLTFAHPDTRRFPALNLARQALRCGHAAGAVFNAANEVAVAHFIQEKLKFSDIPAVVDGALQKCGALSADTLDDILDADRAARTCATELCRAYG